MLFYLFIKLNTFLIYASYRLSPCKVMVLLWSCCAVISEKVRTSRLTWTSAWEAPAWGGWLARARLIDSPPARLLTSARDLFLKPFPSIELSPPCSSFPGGDDWASGGAICHLFAQRFAGDEHPPGMPAPSLSFCCARRSTPKPQQNYCIRIWIQLQCITC